MEASDKPLGLIKNYTKDFGVLPGLYFGEVRRSNTDSVRATVRVRIPQLDGDVDDESLPSAVVMYSYAGVGWGVSYPLSVGEPVIVGVMVGSEARIVLGRFYPEGAFPTFFSDTSDGRGNKIIGINSPSGFSCSIVDKDEDGEIKILTPNGYKIVVRAHKQIEGSEEHSETDKRGVLVETPAGNKIEIDEDSDEEEERAINIQMNGKININTTYDTEIKLDPVEELTSGVRKILIEAVSEDGSGSYFARAELDTDGNVSINATGDISLATAQGSITLSEDKVTIDADVELVQGRTLTLYNAATPIIINEHTHSVLVVTNPPPPTSHTHLTNVTSPTP